ncbi:MAG: hypothetical protein IIU14_02365 [Ruminococcus sp.]|nr:hypothetical protein [Ruminococcus sp.]
MIKVQNKTTKRIRVIQIILFLIEIFLTTWPFIWGGQIVPGKTSFFTAMEMVSYIGSENPVLNTMGLCFLAFLVIPVIAVGFQIFDREYNLKNVVGIICSALGVICVILFVGPANLCFGSMCAMLLYLLTAFLSVMGIFARYLKS